MSRGRRGIILYRRRRNANCTWFAGLRLSSLPGYREREKSVQELNRIRLTDRAGYSKILLTYPRSLSELSAPDASSRLISPANESSSRRRLVTFAAPSPESVCDSSPPL